MLRLEGETSDGEGNLLDNRLNNISADVIFCVWGQNSFGGG